MTSLWKSSSQRGFTGIEVLIVLTIIAIVSILVVNNIQESLARGRDIERRTDINEIQDRLEEYWHANESYPTDLISLNLQEALLTDPNGNLILAAAGSDSSNRPGSSYGVEQPDQEYTYAPYDCGSEIETETVETESEETGEAEPEETTEDEAVEEIVDEAQVSCRQYALYSWLEKANELEIPYSKNNLHNN